MGCEFSKRTSCFDILAGDQQCGNRWAIVRAPWKAAPRVGGVDTRSGGFFGDVGTT